MAAARVRRPLAQPLLEPEGVAVAIGGVRALGPTVNDLRLRRIALVKTWIRELQAEQDKLVAACRPETRLFAQKPTSVLLRLLGLIGSPARASLAQLHKRPA